MISLYVKGREILEEDLSRPLTERAQKIITDCIVQFACENRIKFSRKRLEEIADEIPKIFPKEKSDIYFKKIDGEISGMLYNKYNYSIKKENKKEKIDIDPEDNDSFNNRSDEENPINNTDSENKGIYYMKTWLKTYNNPLFIDSYWSQSYTIRQLDLKKFNKNLSKFLEEWPKFNGLNGFEFLRKDFFVQFPDTHNNLLEKFADFSKQILKMAFKKTEDIRFGSRQRNSSKFNLNILNK